MEGVGYMYGFAVAHLVHSLHMYRYSFLSMMSSSQELAMYEWTMYIKL